MGARCCCTEQTKEGNHVHMQARKFDAPAPYENRHLGCLELGHVEALISSLPNEKLATLLSADFVQRCSTIFEELDSVKRNGFLEGEELTEAVKCMVPTIFYQARVHIDDIKSLALAFDENADGRIDKIEFGHFCVWVEAMRHHGFFEGTAPISQLRLSRATKLCTSFERLLLVSEYLDPDHILQKVALPSVQCVYYHPDGLTLDEFSAQLESAAYIRSKSGLFFKSVALANHGPDEEGWWVVCADLPVSLDSKQLGWPKLMPLFHALAEMVRQRPDQPGRIDLLACDFAAHSAGLSCIEMLEQTSRVKFAASTDATGNVAAGGNWELEFGGRNVAPIYFDETRLVEFTKLMRRDKKIVKRPVKVAQASILQDAKDAIDVMVKADEYEFARMQGATVKGRSPECPHFKRLQTISYQRKLKPEPNSRLREQGETKFANSFLPAHEAVLCVNDKHKNKADWKAEFI